MNFALSRDFLRVVSGSGEWALNIPLTAVKEGARKGRGAVKGARVSGGMRPMTADPSTSPLLRRCLARRLILLLSSPS